MTTPGPRFFSHPQGTVYSNVPNVFAVNAAAATGLFQATPYAGRRWDSAYTKTILIVAGVAIVAIEPHANALACSVLPVGDRLCYSGTSEPLVTEASVDTASFKTLGGSPEEKIEPIGENPVPKLRDLQDPLGAAGSFERLCEPTASSSKMFSGSGSPSDISVPDWGAPSLGDPLVGDLKAARCTHDSLFLVEDVGRAMDEKLDSMIGNSDGGSSGDVLENSRAPAHSKLSPIIRNGDSVDVEVEPVISSQTVGASAPPSSRPIPFTTSENSGDKHKTTLLDWKFIMIAMAVFVGLKQVSRGIFKLSSSPANRGQKKKLSNNKIESTECPESPAASTSLVSDAVVFYSEIIGPNVARSSLEWVASPSPTLHQEVSLSAFGNLELAAQPISSEMNASTGLFDPAAIEIEALSTVKHTACNIAQNGFNLVHLTLFLGILLLILLVYLGFCLAIIAVKLSQTMINNVIESSLDNNAYEQIQNAVPITLPHDIAGADDVENPLRNTLPLGCIFLTQSGPCTIDPRPTRQITLDEEKQTFGLPLDFPASPPSPSTPLPLSCLAGTTSRPGSPKGPRKVTFSEQNEIFILPPNTSTRDRNLRRRLSRRAMAAAGGTVRR